MQNNNPSIFENDNNETMSNLSNEFSNDNFLKQFQISEESEDVEKKIEIK